MGLPCTAFMFMLSLTITTTHAEYSIKVTNKFISDICPKSKYPNKCFRILQLSCQTRRASSLHSLGLGSLEIARFRAETSAYMLKILVKKQRNIPNKEKYNDCRDNYNFAEKKIREAKLKLKKNDFASARMYLEVASKVPISCQKQFGHPVGVVAEINESSDAFFDIALVIVKELEQRSQKYSAKAAFMKKKI